MPGEELAQRVLLPESFFDRVLAADAATPRAWAEVGYRGGDRRRLKRTEAFKEVFPLKAAISGGQLI